MSTESFTAPAFSLTANRLPAWAPYAVGIATAGIAFGVIDGAGVLGGGITLSIIVAILLYIVGLYGVSRVVEGPRSARNRAWTVVIYAAFLLAAVPLVLLVKTLIVNGYHRLDSTFFTHSLDGVTAFDSGGGAYHAILGTLEQVGIAALISIPLGIGGAIYIVEYGGGRLTAIVRFFVDVMTGIPSIVAGLFILSFWVLIVSPIFNNGQPEFSGFAAALALTILMLPTIVRSSEEMLRLVSPALREGAYALGIPKWKTIIKIVLPTAVTGIVTGVMIAIARAAGETAPVILVAGVTDLINNNPFSGNQESLPMYMNIQASAPGQYAIDRAWTAALVLVALVTILTIAAKLLARRNKLT